MKPSIKKLLLLCCIACSFLFCRSAQAQGVWENHHNDIYDFLYRMSQKGLIDFQDNIRPLGRIYLENCLDSLSAKQDRLTRIEKAELAFYLREYTDLSLNDSTAPVGFLKNDAHGRWRFLDINTRNFMLRMDPVLTAAAIESNSRHVKQYSSGFSLYGYAGKHWSYYFSFNDVNEKGTGIDTLRAFTPQTGIVTKIASNKQSHNYSELRGGIAYSFRNGSVSFNNDYLLWGYGDNGRLVLSDKAPAYPYIRLDYRPLPWLKFNYVHAWLNSDIIDSTRSYPTGTTPYGGRRDVYIPKYFATHSLQFTPYKGLDITIGESMVYSDRIDVGYLLPMLFWKVYDNIISNNNINAGANGQLFMQVSSRNHIPNTHLYATVFADEVRFGSLFNKTKSRNQVGATIGASVTDLFVPYLTMGIEYTRINPFVYRNLIPAQDYSNHDYILGDWMGNNADRFIYTIRYTPAPRLKCLFRYQYLRKGGPGTLDQQYFQQPQPPFLFDLQARQSAMDLQVTYEWVNRLNLYGIFNSWNTRSYPANTQQTTNQFTLGVRYGL